LPSSAAGRVDRKEPELQQDRPGKSVLDRGCPWWKRGATWWDPSQGGNEGTAGGGRDGWKAADRRTRERNDHPERRDRRQSAGRGGHFRCVGIRGARGLHIGRRGQRVVVVAVGFGGRGC